MSNPTFVASSSGSGANTTISVNKPTGTADGDLLLAFLCVGSPYPAPTPASGYQLLGANSEGSLYLYGKIANSEPSSENWATTTGFSVIRHAWRPSAGSWANPYSAILSVEPFSLDGGGGGSVSFEPMIQNGSIDSVNISAAFSRRSNGGTVSLSGYTTAGSEASTGPGDNGDSPNYPTFYVAYKSITAGKSGGGTWSFGNGRAGSGMQISLINPNTTRPGGTFSTLGAIAGGYPISLGGNVTSWTVPLPAMKANCLAMIIVTCKTGTIVSGPSGWSAPYSFNNSADGLTIYVYTKVISSDTAHGSTVSLTASGTNNASYQAFVYVWQPNSTVANASGVADDTLDTSVDVPAVSFGGGDSIILLATELYRGDGSGLTSGPSGFVRHFAHSSGGNAVAGQGWSFYKLDNTASNPPSGTIVAASSYTAVTMQLVIGSPYIGAGPRTYVIFIG